ncbi:MAG: glycosyltransferase [Gammaproteobacteria bacterium]
MKPVLLIAYHVPPLRGSSGMQRTISLCRHLPDFGYEPLILTISPRAYPQTADDQLDRIAGVPIERAFGLDSARHLAIKGRFLRATSLPDRYVTWSWGGILPGLRMIRRHQPALIWSTFPVASAHLLGLRLARLSGLPWVADFRDSMTEDAYPPNPVVRRSYRKVEEATVRRCDKATFTAPHAVRMYQERYPDLPAHHWGQIANGYDEDVFDAPISDPPGPVDGPITLVHAGILYPSERDPRDFFAAIAELRDEGRIKPGDLKVVLRATGSDDYYSELLEKHAITDFIDLAPSVAYRDALAEMARVEGLLIFQASNCNHQIPAKLYEYFRVRKPILGLTDPEGDTAATLREAGVDSIVRLDDKDHIKSGLMDFLDKVRVGRAPVPEPEVIETYSRRAGVKGFAAIFDEVLAAR